MSDSRTADKFVLRLPDGLRGRIDDEAAANFRSMNSEIVARLVRSLDGSDSTRDHQAHVRHLIMRMAWLEDLLVRCEAFIGGFQGDPMQDGIPDELLAAIAKERPVSMEARYAS